MKKGLARLLGFRSGTPWKKLVAAAYYAICAAYLVIAMATPPLVEAGVWDTLVVKLSSFVIFVEILSPAIFLSETPLRDKLPFFRQRVPMWSLAGLMAAFVLFQFLFMATESLHTAEYRAAFNEYINAFNEALMEAGGT